MPLKSGKSKKTISGNIRELSSSEKRKGKIGNINTKGMSPKKVRDIEVAIAFNKARRSK